MIKVLMFSLIVVGASGCATIFNDSAPASKGGRYIAGSYDAKKTIFYCPANTEQDDCERIEVNIK